MSSHHDNSVLHTAVPSSTSNQQQQQQQSTSIATLLCDFFEIFTYSILHMRLVYPQTLFTLKRFHNIPVYVAAHPRLQAYVASNIRALIPFIAAASVRRLDVVLVDRLDSNREIERYVCEFEVETTSAQTTQTSATSAADIARQLSLFVAKLKACESMLGPAPSTRARQLSFELQAHADRADAGSDVWVEDEHALLCAYQPADASTTQVVPVKAMERPGVKVRMRCEHKR
ncbi:mitotic arrest deficient-like [Pseudoscourfieldia marina]